MQINAPELYELTGAYADAAAALMDCETDDEYAEAFQAFDAIEADIAEQAGSMARLIRNLQQRSAAEKAVSESFDSEAKRHRAKAKAMESAADRIKEKVTFAMEIAGMEKIRTHAGTWYIVEDVKVDVIDPEAVPDEFVKRVTPEIDKTALKRYIKATGEIIPGVNTTVTRGARIR